jgi:hypothetical protein
VTREPECMLVTSSELSAARCSCQRPCESTFLSRPSSERVWSVDGEGALSAVALVT